MSAREDSGSEDEENVDPRVKAELESLNQAAVTINRLETELEHARTKFRSLLSEATVALQSLHKKLGKCVQKARPYYEVLSEARQAESELQAATLRFQRANSLYRAAKETVALAEEQAATAGEGGAGQSGGGAGVSKERQAETEAAWTEMMNHATSRFMESEAEKHATEAEHQRWATEFSRLQQKRLALEKDAPRTIQKARPYFEMKERLETRLQQERLNVDDLQRALTAAKELYSGALTSLEAISEEIHRQRRRQLLLPARTPGVGAESDDLPHINLDAASVAGSDVCADSEADVASLDSANSYCSLQDTSPEAEQKHTAQPHRYGDSRSLDSYSIGSGQSGGLSLYSQSQPFSHISAEERLALALKAKAAQREAAARSAQNTPKHTVAPAQTAPQQATMTTMTKAMLNQSVEKRNLSDGVNLSANKAAAAASETLQQEGNNKLGACVATHKGGDSVSLPESSLPNSGRHEPQESSGSGRRELQPHRTHSPLRSASTASPSLNQRLFESHARDRIESQRASRPRTQKTGAAATGMHFPILDGLRRTNRQLSPRLLRHGIDLSPAARSHSVDRGCPQGVASAPYGTARELSPFAWRVACVGNNAGSLSAGNSPKVTKRAEATRMEGCKPRYTGTGGAGDEMTLQVTESVSRKTIEVNMVKS